MKTPTRKTQNGFAQTLELLLLATSIVGLVAVSASSLGSRVSQEFSDLGAAVGSLDQSYSLGGMAVAHPGDPAQAEALAAWAGSRFVDEGAGAPAATSGVVLCVAPDRE